MSATNIPAPSYRDYRSVADEISDEVLNHASDLARSVFLEAAESVGKTPRDTASGHWMSVRSHFGWVFRDTMRGMIDRVLAAANVTPEMVENHKAMERADSEADAYKKAQRDKTAKELRATRKKIAALKREAKSLESRVADLNAALRSRASAALGASSADFRGPPKPAIAPTRDGAGLPDAPGVYFVWRGDTVVYVGQSTSLRTRVSLKSHQRITEGDMISFMECETEMLDFTEALYIGCLMPRRNFNGRSEFGRL